MNWNHFKRKQRIEVIQRDRSQLRLSEWRAAPHLVKLAQDTLARPEVRLMLDVLHNEHPSGMVYNDGVPHDVRVVAQARSEGYTMALSNLESLGSFSKQAVPVEDTFGAKKPEGFTED